MIYMAYMPTCEADLLAYGLTIKGRRYSMRSSQTLKLAQADETEAETQKALKKVIEIIVDLKTHMTPFHP